MEFYIYLNSTWQQVDIEINPSLVKAQDTTNDSFSCTLKATTRKTPYAPMTPFKIIDDYNEETIMWIINDSVSVFSVYPKTYKHALTIIQYRYYLNKHLTRNTVFNQPKKDLVKLYAAITCWRYVKSGDILTYQVSGGDELTVGFPEYWTDYLQINYHNKIKSSRIRIKLIGTFLNDNDQNVLEEIYEIDPQYNIQIKTDAVFYIVDANNSDFRVTDDIHISDYNTTIDSEVYANQIKYYLSTHSTAKLAFKYAVNNVTPGYTESAFVERINGDLLSARYQTITCQIEIEMKLYNYNMYDVIKTLRDQYCLTTQNGIKKQPLFNLPEYGTDGLYELLISTYPPDTLSFTQCTFYEALTEVFRFFDAGFKFDENQTLKIEYYNDLSNKVTLKESGASLAHSDKNYVNGRVSYYQNALTNIKINCLNARARVLGVPSESDYGILLPKPIYYLQSLKLTCFGTYSLKCLAGGTGDITVNGTIDGSFSLDLTPFILPKDYWTTLISTKDIRNASTQVEYQTTRAFYERGGDFINFSEYTVNYDGTNKHSLDSVKRCASSRFFGLSRQLQDAANFEYPAYDNYLDQLYDIEYQTMNNGKFETQTVNNKYKGEQLVNQANGGVDLGKFGQSILAESLKDGEPSFTVSWEINDWSKRIKEGDYIIDSKTGDIWVANIINYSIMRNGKQQCTIEFTKNFNALALRIQTDKEKRLTNISNDLSTMCEDVFMEYWYVTDEEPLTMGESLVLGASILRSTLNKTFRYPNDKTFNFQDVNIVSVDTFNGYLEYEATNVIIPLIKYGSGNCICFETQYSHPSSAGYQLIPKEQGSWYDTSYFSKVVLYTDQEGWFDYVSVYFFGKREDEYNIGNYPILNVSRVDYRGSIQQLKYYKKPNEIFAINYEWCFLTHDEDVNKIFIGTKFINENAMVNLEKIANKKFYIRYSSHSSDFQYSIMDTKALEDAGTKVRVYLFATDSDYIITLRADTVEGTLNAKTWAIVDEENNIYFASNKPKVIRSGVGLLYFKAQRNRI